MMLTSAYGPMYCSKQCFLFNILRSGSLHALTLRHANSFALLMQTDKSRMLEMFSREGERVPFETPVEARGNIEVWLQRLVDGMQGTMKVSACTCVQKLHAF